MSGVILALWITVPLAFWSTYYWFTRGSVTRHLGFFHFGLYFFSIYLGAYPLYVADGSVNQAFMLSVVMYPLCVLIGMLVAQPIGRRTRFAGKEVRGNSFDLLLVVSTTAFFLLLIGIYLNSLGPEIPLLKLFISGSAREGRLARYLATKGYAAEAVGSIRLFFWLSRILVDYFTAFLVVFAYYRILKRRQALVTFAAVFTGLLMITLLDTQKYPAIKLVLILALCHFNFMHERVSRRSMVTAGIMAIGVMFFAGVVLGIVSNRYSFDAGILSRAVNTFRLGWELSTTRGLIGQVQPLYAIYEMVPQYYDFFGGATLANPRGVLPYEHVAFPYLVFDFFKTSEPGVRGSAPTVFFGEVFANWGLGVMFVAMVLFGFAVQILHHILAGRVDRIRRAFDVAFFYMIGAYVADFALGFMTVYFDERVYFFMAFYLVRELMRRHLIGRYRHLATAPVKV